MEFEINADTIETRVHVFSLTLTDSELVSAIRELSQDTSMISAKIWGTLRTQAAESGLGFIV